MKEENIKKQAERSVVDILEITPNDQGLGWKDKEKQKAEPKIKKNKSVRYFKKIKVPHWGWHAKTATLKLSSGSLAGKDYLLCGKKGKVIASFFSIQEAQKWWTGYCKERQLEVTKLKGPKQKYSKTKSISKSDHRKVRLISDIPSKDHTKNSNHCRKSGCQKFRVKPHDFCDIHL